MNRILLITPMILGVFLLGIIRRHILGAKDNLLEKHVWLGVGMVVAVCIIGGILINLEIPQDMIPSKWSDFGFWATFWEGEKKSIGLFISSSKKNFDLDVLYIFWNALLYQLAAIAGTISWCCIMSRKKPSLSVID